MKTLPVKVAQPPQATTKSGAAGTQTKPVCTAELVRQLVLNTKKGANKGKEQTFQGYASSKSSTNSNPSSGANLRSSSSVKMQAPEINNLQSLGISNLNRKKPTVVEMDKKQNDERLKRVRENLLKLKQERGSSIALSKTGLGKAIPTVSPAAAKILASSIQEKPYVQMCKPFLKKSSASTTKLLKQLGNEKEVFQGYFSKKATETMSKPPESVAQNQSSEKTVDTSSTGEDAVITPDTAIKSGEPLEAPNTKPKPKKVRTKETAEASNKKSVKISPKKSVSFSPNKPVQSGSSVPVVVRKIEFESDASRMEKIVYVTPVTSGSPKMSPARPRPMVQDLGMKRPTPTHVLKRLVSPPHGKSSVEVPSRSMPSDSTEAEGAPSELKDSQVQKKYSSPNKFCSYLEGSPMATVAEAVKRQISDQDCQIKVVNAIDNSIIGIRSSVKQESQQALDRVKDQMLKRKRITKYTPVNKRLKLLTKVSEEDNL